MIVLVSLKQFFPLHMALQATLFCVAAVPVSVVGLGCLRGSAIGLLTLGLLLTLEVRREHWAGPLAGPVPVQSGENAAPHAPECEAVEKHECWELR